MKTMMYYGGSPNSIIPGAFGGNSPRVRLSTPPLDFRSKEAAKGTSGVASVHKVSSMDFDLLFEAGASNEVEPMETVAEEMHHNRGAEDEEDEEEEQQKEKKEEIAHALDPVSVYVRVVSNLSRPRDALEHNIAKRFAAACKRVGAGELGDAAHIEALQRAFNSLKMDPELGDEAVEKTEEDYAAEAAAAANCETTCTSASDSPAFVATTPGAAGHAALLNLRHSFLWLKPSEAATAGAAHAPLTRRRVHAHDVQQQREQQLRRSGKEGHAEILVLEPDIKAHFVISRPTAGYQRLVNALPDHFVGTHKRLVELVDFLCEQMLVSFRENGMSVPPWRKNKSILSKWFLPTAKSGSQPTTPTGSPPSTTAAATRRRQSFGLDRRAAMGGGGVGMPYPVTHQQQQQQPQPHQPSGARGCPVLSSPSPVVTHAMPRSPIDYAAPVVGEAASPNKVEFGFTAVRMAVRAA